MLAPAALAVIAVTVVATSFVSGIFGMAGGLILLGILLVFLDVAPAMVLFGTIQTASNGWRAWLWRAHVRWPIIWRYVLGSAAMFLVLRLVSFIPSKAVVYLALGIIPFLATLLPKSLTPDIERPGAPYFCGAFIMLLQLIGGAAGHVLDLFFQNSSLDRKSIVATKAVTQVAGHLLRVAYFGTFAAAFDATIPWWLYAGTVALAILGTTLAAGVLERMTDADFRAWSRRIVIAISIVYLMRGIWLLVAP